MRKTKLIMVVAVMMMITTIPVFGSATDQGTVAATELTASEQMALEAVNLINAQRTAAGINELIVNDDLMKSAAIRAEECVDKFSHERPDGSSFSTSVTFSGFTRIGENIAAGTHLNVESAVEIWMNSEGHKKNILDPNWTETGIGFCITDGKVTTAQIFIKR